MSVLAPPLGPLLGEADEIYLSFEETPHDVLPAGYTDAIDSAEAVGHKLDGTAFDRARLEWETGSRKAAATSKLLAGQPHRVIVPLPRVLKLRSVGTDVLAVERALAAAHERKWGNFTHAFGGGVLAEIKSFQHKHGIPATGIYGEETHRKLSPFFDPYGISLMSQSEAKTVVQRAQKRFLSACMISYNYRARNHYTQGPLRWMMISHHIRQEAIPSWSSTWADCSAWFTWLYWDCGLNDPNQLGFTGGWTGTLGAHGTAISNWSKAHVGAAFLYGPGTHEHVQAGVGGMNTIGDGAEIGPLYLPANYRSDLNVVREYAGLS